ncbi:MAG TPA: DUF4920 domain-containing protein [Candidatus Binatia bacterium]|jgi:hypothetical protein|nr:DUF4920 domain-containing protein [Candidatus Binatia bacterium]
MRFAVLGLLLLVLPAAAAGPVPAVYGREPRVATSTPLADILREPARFTGREVRVQGVVSGVCQRKGCWMMLRDGKSEVRVRFRDYAFFVPRDVSGREAAVEGTAQVEVVSEAMRRHLASDAGTPPEEVARITGDQTTVQLVADAVAVCGPAGSGACPPAATGEKR